MTSQNVNELDTAALFFRDSVSGRCVLLRGVNLSAIKGPLGQPSHTNVFDEAETGTQSFVGSPLDLRDGSADVHLARLRGWGFNVLRYNVTWEALEHAGPGKYDTEFIDYTVQLLRRCHAFGFRVFIDPHQDVWSRFSGGSGAPIWTLHACGLNPRGFSQTSAAFLHSEWRPPIGFDSDVRPEEFPQMMWTTNHTRLAVMTMFTLFFGGKDFAPLAIIDGVNIQDWLQDHFSRAFQQLARAIGEAGLLDECVFGWDGLNEPDSGYISLPDLSIVGKEMAAKIGVTPTSIEGMRLGMGMKQDVNLYTLGKTGPHKSGHVLVDPNGHKAWLDEEFGHWGWQRDPKWKLGVCIWALHGVWDLETGNLLRSDYFARPRQSSNEFEAFRSLESVPQSDATSKGEADSGSVSFTDRYWADHQTAWSRAMREVHPRAILFVQASVFVPPPSKPILPALEGRVACSPHFYDGLTIMHRHWHTRWNADVVGIMRGKYKTPGLGLRIGKSAVRKLFAGQLRSIASDASKFLGEFPTLLGETGIPMDLDGAACYDPTSDGYRDYSNHVRALDAILSGCDESLLNYTLWNFDPYNTHEFGDNWNREDLSLWSVDDIYAGPTTWNEQDLQALTAGPSTTKDDSYPIKQHPDSNISTPPANASLFLEQGARALAAFCRPYPVHTAGFPERMSFEIETSVFELDIRVDAESTSKSTSNQTPEEEIKLPTEVYIPFIHYRATPSAIGRDRRTHVAASGVQVPLRAEFTEKLAEAGRERFLYAGELALDIEVSEGRFVVEGQLLRWWYSRLGLGGSSRVVKVKVTRRGGALKW